MSKKINLLETGNMLLAAQKIVLCCHVSPDGDTLGSALGLARLLEQKGKEVTVFVDDDIISGRPTKPQPSPTNPHGVSSC